jgi:phosphatidylserine decarboxylase
MDEIVYFDRYTQRLQTEKVYGDRALRWTYGTPAGRVALGLLVKRAVFSRWYGWRMNQAASRRKIAAFVEHYDLDPTEFLERLESFAHFNEFFYRKLKPTARPIDPDPSVAVFPADGRHLCMPDISQASGLFVKGEMFSLQELLKDRSVAQQYASGSLLLSRLCPVDYHRFHFPTSGVPSEAVPIKGPLYSVNPIALRQNIRILATNKRCITQLQTENFGKVLLLEIGATCVGSICQTFCPNANIAKGSEKGYFQFGGSSTITIFEPGRIRFDQDLIDHSQQHREVFAHMGDHVGRAVS